MVPDHGFYVNIFAGETIPERQFAAYARMAERWLLRHMKQGVRGNEMRTDFNMAVCAIADSLYAEGGFNCEERLTGIARVYLWRTGVLGR